MFLCIFSFHNSVKMPEIQCTNIPILSPPYILLQSLSIALHCELIVALVRGSLGL